MASIWWVAVLGLAALLLWGALLAWVAALLPGFLRLWESAAPGPLVMQEMEPAPMGQTEMGPPPSLPGRERPPPAVSREPALDRAPEPREEDLVAGAIVLALALYREGQAGVPREAPITGAGASPWTLAGRWQAMQPSLHRPKR